MLFLINCEINLAAITGKTCYACLLSKLYIKQLFTLEYLIECEISLAAATR